MSLLLAPISQWLILWVVLLLVLRLLYAVIRPYLLQSHPADSAALQLFLFCLPLTLSGAWVWAVNGGAGGFLLSHCHGEICSAHRPDIRYPVIMRVFGVGLFALLIVRVLWIWQRDRKRVHQLLSLAKPTGEWWVLPTSVPTVFTLGFWHCKLVASQGLLTALSSEALNVIADHEHAHRKRGDNFRNFVARLALLPLLPLCRPLLDDLDLNHEKACDLAACERAPATFVAQTIVDVTRLQHPGNTQLNASFFASSHIAARVQALLAPVPKSAASLWSYAGMGIAVVLLFIAGLDPLHHLIEWLW